MTGMNNSVIITLIDAHLEMVSPELHESALYLFSQEVSSRNLGSIRIYSGQRVVGPVEGLIPKANSVCPNRRGRRKDGRVMVGQRGGGSESGEINSLPPTQPAAQSSCWDEYESLIMYTVL